MISVKGLTKIFLNGDSKLCLFSNIEWELQDNTRAIITGESGSGKSTFLNLLSGLDSISSGSIFFNDFPVHKHNEEKLAEFRLNHVGLIFQFHYLLKEFTALENTMIPSLLLGRSKRLVKERAEQLLQKVGLEQRFHHFPPTLSGGERQRVAVARALMNDPDYIFADEPTGNLDERNSRIVENMLFDLVNSEKKTLVLVTHNSQLAEYADVHYHLQNGEFVKK